MKHILRCPACRQYTMNLECACGCKAVSVKPPKYSPDDKYGDYRRQVKRQMLVEKGFL